MVKPTYLICVTEDNHNKYYNMIPQGDTFTVEYGRVDVTKQTTTYPISKWQSTYNSKIKKGYKDISSLKTALVEEISQSDKSKTMKQIECESVRKVIEYLRSISRQMVEKNYSVTADKVTEDMCNEAQDIINYMQNVTNLFIFNRNLLNLFTVIPRKMTAVRDYIAKSDKDFGAILDREQTLLDAMRANIYVPSEHKKEKSVNTDYTLLDEIGITMEECTADDIATIKRAMGEGADKFKRAWKVVNKTTQKRFDDFVKSNNISRKKLLFHGSRNENWFSILKTGLLVRPTNVTITGKMFGNGIYFAPKCQKSIGYTSLRGSYWASGSSNTAYMALMDVAYGSPYDVYSFDSKFYNLDYNKLPSGKNCLHAHSGNGMLRNDEIVIYKQDQCTIKYFIEIEN